MIGKVFMDAFKKTTEQAGPPPVTWETVQAVQEDGRYVVRGMAIQATGDAKLYAGARVAVSWSGGRPAYILSHRWKRGGAMVFRQELGGVLEAIYLRGQFNGLRDVVFRNDQQVTVLSGSEHWATDVRVDGLGWGIGSADNVYGVFTAVPGVHPTLAVPVERGRAHLLLLSRAAGSPSGGDLVSSSYLGAKDFPSFSTGHIGDPPDDYDLGFPDDARHLQTFITSTRDVVVAGAVGDRVIVASTDLGLLLDTAYAVPVDVPVFFVKFLAVAEWGPTVAQQRLVISGGPSIVVTNVGDLADFTGASGPYQFGLPTFPPIGEGVVIETPEDEPVTGLISVSGRYVLWGVQFHRSVRRTVPTPIEVYWDQFLVRYFLTDLSTLGSVLVSEMETTAASALGLAEGFTNTEHSRGSSAAASVLTIQNVQPGWLFQDATMLLSNAADSILNDGTTTANLAGTLRSINPHAQDPLGFGVNLSDVTTLPELLLPVDGSVDSALFTLMKVPTVMTAAGVPTLVAVEGVTLPMAVGQIQLHVVPDTSQLGRRTQ